MKISRPYKIFFFALLFLGLISGNASVYIVAGEDEGNLNKAGKKEGKSGDSGEIHVPPPPFSEGIFPCSNCHSGMEVNKTKRAFTEEHTNIKLKHDEEHRWCLDCHNPDDRDKLRLADGTTIEFSQSYLLCGQCHGEKLRDWKAGIHGKRTGSWNGKKEYLLCAHCHNPHMPKFKPLEPLPPPKEPDNLK